MMDNLPSCIAARATTAEVIALHVVAPNSVSVVGAKREVCRFITLVMNARASHRIAPNVSATKGEKLQPADSQRARLLLFLLSAAWSISVVADDE